MCARPADLPPAQDAAKFLDAFIVNISVVLRTYRHMGGKSAGLTERPTPFQTPSWLFKSGTNLLIVNQERTMPAAKLTQASAKNAIAAAAAAGLTIKAMVVQSDGSLRLEFFEAPLANVANSEPEVPSREAPKQWGQKR